MTYIDRDQMLRVLGERRDYYRKYSTTGSTANLFSEIMELITALPVLETPAPQLDTTKLETCYDELRKLPPDEWGGGAWNPVMCRDLFLSGYAQAMKDAGIVSNKRIVPVAPPVGPQEEGSK